MLHYNVIMKQMSSIFVISSGKNTSLDNPLFIPTSSLELTLTHPLDKKKKKK